MEKYGLSLEGLIVNKKSGNPMKLNCRTGLFTSKSGNQRYFKNGSLHREDGPAVIKMGLIMVGDEETTGVVEQEWWIEGKKVRYTTLSRPSRHDARKPYRDNRLPENKGQWSTLFSGRDVYLKDGKKHRLDGPACVIYNICGQGIDSTPYEENWYVDGKRHRLDGPAVTRTNDYAHHQAWFVDGKIHRVDGPAAITTHTSWVREEWYQNGKRHREDGPAHSNEYYIKGHRYDKDAYDKRRIKGFLKTV